MKNLINKRSLIALILSFLLLIPAGIALAGPRTGQPLQVIDQTQTAVPTTIPPTATPQKSSVLPDILAPIPGLLPNEPLIQISDTTDSFTFEQFGFDENTMRGPFTTEGYYFDLPVTWVMKQGAILQLSLDTFYTGSGNTLLPGTPSASNYIGSVEIQYNYTTIGRIDLSREGRTQVDIPIPLEVINSYGTNQGHSILLILDSEINCTADSSTTVVVRSTSQLYMPHDLIAPPVDLRLLPSPFSQDTFNSDFSIVIVPDQPTAEELQAALSISSGFGSMTFNELSLSLLPVSQVTTDILASTNLIFVGKPNGLLPLLQ